MNKLLTGLSEQTYELMEKLGVGGEGDVYSLRSPHDDKVLKIYHKSHRPKNKEKNDKIRALRNFSPKNPKFFNQVAWIKDIILDGNEVSGLVLQKATGKGLYQIMDDKSLTWDTRLAIAKNLCGILHYFQEEGQVIGDFSDGNFLVNLEINVLQMVDIDSIHFKDNNGKIYRCCTAIADTLAPELHGIHLGNAPLPTFNTQTDLWALAIHIFRLLMYNYHPFSASTVKGAPSQVVSQNRRIKNCQTPFFKHEEFLSIPQKAAEVEQVFPETTIQLFRQTFIDGHSEPEQRVGAKEWYLELDKLSKNLTTCPNNKSHIYYSGKQGCPWCLVDRKANDPIFYRTPHSCPIVFISNQLVNLESQVHKMIGEFCDRLQESEWGDYADCEIAFVSGQTPLDQVDWLTLPSTDYSIPDDFMKQTNYLSDNLNQAIKAIKRRLASYWEEGFETRVPHIVICSDSSINGYLEIFNYLDLYELLGITRFFIAVFDDNQGVTYYDMNTGHKGNTCEWLVDRMSDGLSLPGYFYAEPAPTVNAPAEWFLELLD